MANYSRKEEVIACTIPHYTAGSEAMRKSARHKLKTVNRAIKATIY